MVIDYAAWTELFIFFRNGERTYEKTAPHHSAEGYQPFREQRIFSLQKHGVSYVFETIDFYASWETRYVATDA